MIFEKFSWFLGFLTTDGSLVRPSPRGKGNEEHLSFCLHHDDNEVLYKIKDIIKTTSNIRLYPKYKSPQCQINIYDRKDIFTTYWFIKKDIPNHISNRHFIRGLVDGDGCLNYRGTRESFRINIVNESFNILNKTSRIITNTLGLELKIPKPRQGNIFIIEWEGKVARLIAWWLYHGEIDDMVLKRKKEYFNNNLKVDTNNSVQEFLTSTNISYHKRDNGIVLDLNVPSYMSLNWCHRIQKIINNGTPIPLNKGTNKFFGLYLPIINTQSISFKEEMMT
jgi:hypothetical protein